MKCFEIRSASVRLSVVHGVTRDPAKKDMLVLCEGQVPDRQAVSETITHSTKEKKIVAVRWLRYWITGSSI